MLTLAEYIMDYASGEVAEKGWRRIEDELQQLENGEFKVDTAEIRNRIEKIKQGKRDLYF
jgi:2-iminoacetate synthase